MSFIRYQIKQIRSGGMPVLWRKMRSFPRWFLWWFATSKYGSGVAYYGCRIAVALKPDWAGAHVLLAETLIHLGRFDEAFAAWERAFLLKPDWPDIHSRIGTGFFLCGQNRAVEQD